MSQYYKTFNKFYNQILKVPYLRNNKLLLLVLLSCLIAIIFALPDLYIDYKTGNSIDPIRSFQPNNAHYLTILNAARNSGEMVPNSYLHEQQEVPSHYAMIQFIVAKIPHSRDISIAILWTVLRIMVAVGYFLILFKILEEIGCKTYLSAAISFSAVCIWGYIRFQSMALGNWYLPFMLGGMYLGYLASGKDMSAIRRLALLSLSLILFSWHSVSFSLGGLAISLILIFAYFQEDKNKRKSIVNVSIIWVFFSLIIFKILYAPFLFGHNDTAISTLSRVVQFSSTHLIYHPIETAVLVVAVWALYLTRQFGYFAFGISAIVGLNSNLITGFYFANDHYIVLTEAIVIIAAVSLWLTRDNYIQSKWLANTALVAGLWYLFAGLSHLAFKPAFIGRYMVVTLSMVAIFVGVYFKRYVRDFFLKYSVIIILSIFSLSTAYAAVLVYKGIDYPLQTQRRAENFEPLIHYLRQEPYSVVLANSTVSSYIALYTQNRVYWSDLLFTDVISDKEILNRWLVSRIFFPNDELANGELAIDTVYGAEIRCRHFRLFAKPMMGIFDNSFIARLREKDCPDIERVRQEQKQFLDETLQSYKLFLKTNTFSPEYRLDLLVVSNSDDAPLNILKRDFYLVRKIGDFTIYKLKKTN